MKIVITNYHCASNRGDAAIMEGLISSLEQEFADPEITIATKYPEASKILHRKESVEQRMAPFGVGEIERNLKRGYAMLGAITRTRGVRLPKFNDVADDLNLKPHLEADVVIGTGGHYITDIYFPGKIGVLLELYFAKLLGKPVVLAAQSAGPFENEAYREMIRFVLNEIDLITTRDKQTKESLSAIGVDETPIHFTADAAFAMDVPEAPTSPLTKFEETTLSTGEHEVSISAREWPHFDERGGEETYVQSLSDLADWLVTERNANVRFISTCTGFDGYHTDDRIIAQQIRDRMHQSDSASILYGEYSPQELVRIYEKMDVHIGTRMHSNILAILAGTPILPIEYQFKTKGLAEQFGIEDYLIDINDVTSTSLRNLTEELLANRTSVENQLEQRLPEIQQRSQENGELIRKLYSDVGTNGSVESVDSIDFDR